jgi:hypothetical protein
MQTFAPRNWRVLLIRNFGFHLGQVYGRNPEELTQAELNVIGECETLVFEFARNIAVYFGVFTAGGICYCSSLIDVRGCVTGPRS